jgi:colicin import membrane protein
MTDTQNAEVIELSLVKTIETKLVQANVTEQVLSALREKYAGMKLAAIDDKESYLEIKAAAKECAKVRTLTVKICKEGREEAVKAQKQWIAKEKEIVGQVAEVEDALDAEIKRFDDEVARIEQEEKDRQEEAYINRQAALTKMGAVYSNGEFTLGEASFEANLIKGSSEEVWVDAVLPKFQEEYEKIEAVKIAEQKKKDDEAAELKRQQDELADKKRIFDEQQAAFKKQQEEAQRLEQEKQRADELEKEKIKSVLQKQRFELMFPINPTGADVDMNNLWALGESDFAEKLAAKTVEFEKAKAEKERLAEEKRLDDIEAAKQKAIKDEQERVAEQARLDEIKKREAEEKRLSELDAASDKTKWEEFIKQVSVIDMFEMRSGQYRKKMQIAKEKLEEILSL